MFLYRKADRQAFSNRMQYLLGEIMSLTKIKASINQIWKTFRNGIDEVINKFVPTKLKRNRHLHEPLWFNRCKVCMCKTENGIYYDNFKKNNATLYFEKYKIIRKRIKSYSGN